ncbi:HepT-like ribonuclease domain-containing protein [Bifidobacterium ruminantium]|uniref:HepT-like ribonuclease domain-containing protein n=1 Tax=Bifidobacterium ruminantium TaxID=78346 RepID=UPI002491BDCB|nr:HepT-like ribonuclease domain-containing protein [Bifidobacterium ruminantium]
MRALNARRFRSQLSVEESADDDEKRNAMAMAIARSGEHAKKASKESRESESGIPWRGMSGMRDWIAHDHGGPDFDRLHYAVTHEVPQVLMVLRPYAEQQVQMRLRGILSMRRGFNGVVSCYVTPAGVA